MIEKAKSYGKPANARRIYQVKGVDKGRNTWYFVLVTGSEKAFLNALKDDIIHLEQYGEILLSAYGDGPDTKIRKSLMEEYGIDSDDGNISQSVNQLNHFLRFTSGNINAVSSILDFENVNSKLMENPFLIMPTGNQLRELFETAKAKALKTKIEGWTDGNVEPFISWKIAIIIYTMERPYQLYRLVNAHFHTNSPSADIMVHHMGYIKLLPTAFDNLPKSLEYTGTFYRGINVGKKETLKNMVANPETYFKANTILTFAGFTSASKNKAIGQNFCKGLMYEMRNVVGYDITSLSLYQEMEVILPPPITVRTVSFSRDNNNLHVVVNNDNSNLISYL